MSQHASADAELAEVVAGIRGDWDMKETRGPDELFSGEVFWRDHQPWLLEQGYKLRARYQPDWKPSWKTGGRWKKDCEDSYVPKRVSLMDAVRVTDGTSVIIKLIHKPSHPHEVEIGQYLSMDAFRADAHNHSVPIQEVLAVPDDEECVLAIMPLLRKFDDPPFGTLGEAAGCVKQAFEGIQFMHHQNVAHRDCSGINFMMDPSSLFPVSFHPILTDMTRDIRTKVRPLTRSECTVKYYWIDFGIACKYRPEERPVTERVVMGADKSPPEHKNKSKKARCDPFATDVYYVGNLVRESFLKKYRNLDFLEALVKRMVQDDPSKRPSMDDVMTEFTKLIKNLSRAKLNARLVNRKESFVETLVRDTSYAVRGFFPRSSSSQQINSSKKTGRV